MALYKILGYPHKTKEPHSGELFIIYEGDHFTKEQIALVCILLRENTDLRIVELMERGGWRSVSQWKEEEEE